MTMIDPNGDTLKVLCGYLYYKCVKKGVGEEQIGPVRRRLGEVGPVIPFVFSGYGEVSEEVHDLIGTLAYLRHAMESRAGGKEGAEGRMGKSRGISGED